jgi:glycosyltransferase involved in cell wall biosynthesis
MPNLHAPGARQEASSGQLTSLPALDSQPPTSLSADSSKVAPKYAPTLSVVVPLFNESGSLAPLFARLEPVLTGLKADGRVRESEIVFVDDGSRDATFAEVAALNALDPSVKGVRFARNFGKEAAMAAGLRAANGEAVVLMDGDLQHPPELIPELLAAWRGGAMMATAARRSRATDPALRRWLSKSFYRVFASISEVSLTEGAGDFRVFDRRVVDAINQLPERTRFMKGITSWVGFKQVTVDFEPEERAVGSSSFNLVRLFKYALDGLSAFSTLPLRIWSIIGLVISVISVLYGAYLTLRTVLYGIDVPGYASIMVATLFLSGIQLISLGVIGEYLGRVFTEVKDRPLYLVAETLGLDSEIAS